jgi:hypothetical protein
MECWLIRVGKGSTNHGSPLRINVSRIKSDNNAKLDNILLKGCPCNHNSSPRIYHDHSRRIQAGTYASRPLFSINSTSHPLQAPHKSGRIFSRSCSATNLPSCIDFLCNCITRYAQLFLTFFSGFQVQSKSLMR